MAHWKYEYDRMSAPSIGPATYEVLVNGERHCTAHGYANACNIKAKLESSRSTRGAEVIIRRLECAESA